MDHTDLNFNGLGITVSHLIGNFQIEQEVRVVIEHDRFIKTPVEGLQQSGLTEGVVAENNGNIPFFVTGEIDSGQPLKLSEIPHLQRFDNHVFPPQKLFLASCTMILRM